MNVIVTSKKELKGLTKGLIEADVVFSVKYDPCTVVVADRAAVEAIMDIMASWYPNKPRFREFLEIKFNESVLGQAAQEGE